MARRIKVHRVGGSGVPDVQAMAYNSGQSIVEGSIVVDNGGSLDLAGANPTEIVGVALQAADTNPGFDAANSPTVITGRQQTISVVRPNQQTIFSADMTNNSATVVAPAQSDVNTQYGLTAYSGVWTVDRNKSAANLLVEVVGFDADQDRVFFKFLNSALSSD